MPQSNDLTPLFKPQSVALVGASDKNPWCGLVLANLVATKFTGPVHLINKSGNPALGRSTVRSCAEIGEPVDAAFVAVPAAALTDALDDLAAGGIRHAVVVTSGFAELGPEGAAMQDSIISRADELGLTLLGPNSLGVINFVDGAVLSPIPLPSPVIPNGRIGLISQSGATTSALQEYGLRQGVGFTYSVALGNEAQVDLPQVIDFMVHDEFTRVIAIYAEAIRDGAGFISACERALAAEKPIVILKVGVGELAAAVAQAHTGALVGDNRVFEAVCRRYGVIRVDSLEQLILTADLLAYTGVMDPRPIAALSMSGGACGMIADLADVSGVPFATLEEGTLEKLDEILPGYSTPNNPLDITGAAMADATIYSRSIEALAADSGVGLILTIQDPVQSEDTVSLVAKRSLVEIGKGLSSIEQKSVLLGQAANTTSEFGRNFIDELGIPYAASSMIEIMKSIAAGRRWSDRVRKQREGATARPAPSPSSARPKTEQETLDYLSSQGVPVIPAQVASSANEVGRIAEELGGEVALKILSEDIAHKTEVGGVVLGVSGSADAKAAYDRIMASVSAAKPDARIEGVLVSPMRQRDVELFVGIARDPSWGLAIAVGLGGVWVEVLADVSLRTLPVGPDDVLEMLDELKAGKLLDGYRGAAAVDRQRLVEVVATIGDAALALGPDLASLEINPLSSGSAGIEALDGLTIWSEDAAE